MNQKLFRTIRVTPRLDPQDFAVLNAIALEQNKTRAKVVKEVLLASKLFINKKKELKENELSAIQDQ